MTGAMLNKLVAILSFLLLIYYIAQALTVANSIRIVKVATITIIR